MTFPLVLTFITGATLFLTAPKRVTGQELPPADKNAANLTTILKQSIKSSAKYCSSLYDMTTERILALVLVDSSDDRDAKCFLHCMLQRYQLMDGEGDYHQEHFQAFLDYIPDSAFRRSIVRNLPACVKKRGNTTCETAEKFLRCFYKRARVQNAQSNGKGSQQV